MTSHFDHLIVAKLDTRIVGSSTHVRSVGMHIVALIVYKEDVQGARPAGHSSVIEMLQPSVSFGPFASSGECRSL